MSRGASRPSHAADENDAAVVAGRRVVAKRSEIQDANRKVYRSAN